MQLVNTDRDDFRPPVEVARVASEEAGDVHRGLLGAGARGRLARGLRPAERDVHARPRGGLGNLSVCFGSRFFDFVCNKPAFSSDFDELCMFAKWRAYRFIKKMINNVLE